MERGGRRLAPEGCIGRIRPHRRTAQATRDLVADAAGTADDQGSAA